MDKEKINVLIVEDEALVALDLAKGLEREGYNIIGPADNAEEAEFFFRENDVDIILTDVKIIGTKDGVDTAASLLSLKKVPVIFLTAFTDDVTVDRAKKTYPAAFLTKPYNFTSVRLAIAVAINNLSLAKQQKAEGSINAIEKYVAQPEENIAEREVILQMEETIFVRYNYRFIKVHLSELKFIEADNNYVNLITTSKKITLRLSLNQILEKITYKKLVRIHRSYAININWINSFNENSVFVDKAELPMGKNYRKYFFEYFNGGPNK